MLGEAICIYIQQLDRWMCQACVQTVVVLLEVFD
jgi:hypothetical protein